MTMTGTGRNVNIDVKGLETAFHDVSFETHYFLDRQTGAVVRINGAVWRQLEDIYQELNREGNYRQSGFERAVRGHNLSQENRNALTEAHRIECELGTRFRSLPPAHPHLELRDMEEYIATLANPGLCESLWDALRNPDPARHFVQVLSRYPNQPAGWHAFHDEQVRARVRFWLGEEGIKLPE